MWKTRTWCYDNNNLKNNKNLATNQSESTPTSPPPPLPSPEAPLTCFDDGDGGLSEFFGSEILAQSDLFRSLKDAGIFLGHERKQRPGVFISRENWKHY